MNDESTKYLDEIDIGEFLEPDRIVSDVMCEIDAVYGGDYERLTGNDSIFTGWTDDDFADYIRGRYGKKCYERTVLMIK